MMRLRRLSRFAGWALVALALVYVGREAVLYRDALAAHRLPEGVVPMLAGLGFAYGLSLLLLAEQWHRIVGLLGAEPRARTYPSYTMTLVARYLPGNVFHLVGRAAWLRGGALGDGALARATLLELLFTPLGALLVLACLFPAFQLPGLPLTGIQLALGAALTAAATLGAILYALRGKRLSPAALLTPTLLATLFMASLAALFALLAATLAAAPALLAAAAALAAWLIGYATPGAPGGLGVREAVLVAMLSGAIPTEAALLLALVFRGVTIVGDVVCSGLGWLCAAYFRQRRSAAASALL